MLPRLLACHGLLRPSTHAAAVASTAAALATTTPPLADLLPAARTGPRPSTLGACVHGSDAQVWEAVEFRKHSPPKVVKTSATSLGLAPRDAALLRPPSSTGGGGQRATLAAREVVPSDASAAAGSTPDAASEPLILVRTEAVRAAVGRTSAFVFPARRPADTAALLAAVDAAAAAAATPFGPPFELAVLEALLSESVRVFDRRARQLRLLADGVETDVARALRWAGGAAASTGELGRLLPVQRTLVELTADVREARSAVEAVAATPRALASLCLSDAPAATVNGEGVPRARLLSAEALLSSYSRQLESVESSLQEMGENLDAAREAWGFALDAHRNRTLRLSLHMSLATAAVAVACGTPAAFLGANIDVPSVSFWPLVAGCSAVAVAGYGGLVSLWQVLPTVAHRRRVADARALRDLLHHLDDLDAVLASVRAAALTAGTSGSRLSRDAFARAVASAGAILRPDEVDALFRVYDVNESGFLEPDEVLRRAGAAWDAK